MALASPGIGKILFPPGNPQYGGNLSSPPCHQMQSKFPHLFCGSNFSEIFSSFGLGCRCRTRSSSLSVTSKFTLTVSLQMMSPLQPRQSCEQLHPVATSSKIPNTSHEDLNQIYGPEDLDGHKERK